MEVIDGFTFFNERDLLRIRLETLKDSVDRFVLVECELTQTGKEKPLYFDQYQNEFSDFKDRIEHIIVSKEECAPHIGRPWGIENFQRNCISKYAPAREIANCVIISDLDEIPTPNAVKQAVDRVSNLASGVGIDMHWHLYFANLVNVERKWRGSVVARGGYKPQWLRGIRHKLAAVEGGWHFSAFGGLEAMRKKYLACVEPFDKNLVADAETVIERSLSKDGKFVHPDDNHNNPTMNMQLLHDTPLPDYLSIHRARYAHLFLENLDVLRSTFKNQVCQKP